jgi:glutamate synthase domain-containing protein 1
MQTFSTGSTGDNTYPLYEARWEHDACGTGFLADVSGASSHALIKQALIALTNLTHRGAQDADAETSDGSGLLTAIPRELLCAELQAQQISLASPEDLAVGMLFLPSASTNLKAYFQARRVIERVLDELHIPLLTWRDPPLDPSVLGTGARASLPAITQVLLARPEELSADEYERFLYHARRLIEKRWQEAELADGYIASFSSRTIVYKGLLAPSELASFYLDLPTSVISVLPQFFTSATAPILFLPGRWPSRCACWHTTARLTPFKVIATGCRPASAR